MVYREVKQPLTDLERMSSLLTREPEIEDKPAAKALALRDGAVRFDHVDFRYDPAADPARCGLPVPRGRPCDRRLDRRRQIDTRPAPVSVL